MKHLLRTVSVISALAFVPFVTQAQPQGRGTGQGSCLLSGAPQAVRPLTPKAKAALLTALTSPDGEYAAFATYTAVVQKHGALLPYANIRQSEQRHIATLKRLFTRYNLAIPRNDYLGKISLPKTMTDIAQSEAQAETKNVTMYDRLLSQVKEYADITRVFNNLKNASQNRHLPAFQLAAKNGGVLTPALCQSVMGPGNGNGEGIGRRGRGQRGAGFGWRQGRRFMQSEF